MTNYNAIRNVGDIVTVDGPYFGSKAVITEFFPNSAPTQARFVITEPAASHIKVGMTEIGIADHLTVVQAAA